MNSNIINNYFPHVFLISTVEDTGRQRHTMNYLDSLGVRYNLRIAPHTNFLQGVLCDDFVHSWDAKSYTHVGAMSLRLCYLSIFAECIYTNKEKILILEDDVVFEPGFDTNFKNFMDNVPSNWDLLNIGYHESKNVPGAWKFETLNDTVSACDAAYTTHMVAVNCTYNMQRLCDKIKTSNIPIDYIFMYFTHVAKVENKEYMTNYIPNKVLCRQLSYRSDAEKQSHQIYKSLITP